MAMRIRCPKCGGIRIKPDIGPSIGHPPKGVTYIPSGNECFCDREVTRKEAKDK